MKRNIIIGALLLILGFVLGVLCRTSRVERVVDIQRDTTVVVDTHIIEKPIEVSKVIKETMLVEVHDTTRIHDTLYVQLPFEIKTYKGADYYAEVSGYNPSLCHLEVYPKTKVIKESVTQSVTNRHALSIGIEAGYCRDLSIPIYLEYERMLHKNLNFDVGLCYDLHFRQFGVKSSIEFQFGW